MNTWCSVLLACLLAAVSVVQGQFGSDLYNGDPAADRLLEELQKRLADARGDSDAFYSDFGNFPWYTDELSAETRDDGMMQEDIREPEHLSHGSQSQGFQYISGRVDQDKINVHE